MEPSKPPTASQVVPVDTYTADEDPDKSSEVVVKKSFRAAEGSFLKDRTTESYFDGDVEEAPSFYRFVLNIAGTGAIVKLTAGLFALLLLVTMLDKQLAHAQVAHRFRIGR